MSDNDPSVPFPRIRRHPKISNGQVATAMVESDSTRSFTSVTVAADPPRRDPFYTPHRRVVPPTSQMFPTRFHGIGRRLVSPSLSDRLYPAAHADRYYRGLPSCPKLVVGSRAGEWSPKFLDQHEQTKSISAVPTGHPIAEIWRKPFGKSLLGCLEAASLPINLVDIISIGYHQSQMPVVFWIGIAPQQDQNRPSQAVRRKCEQLVRRCEQILAEEGMSDVEVEVRETEYVPLARMDAHQYSRYKSTVSGVASFCQYLGQGVAADPPIPTMIDEETGQEFFDNPQEAISVFDMDCWGTLGPFLKEKSTSTGTIYALTAAHVFTPREPNYSVVSDGPRGPLVKVHSDDSISTVVGYLESRQSDIEKQMSRLENNRDPAARPHTQARLQEFRHEKADILNLIGDIEQFQLDLEGAELGQVICQPPVGGRRLVKQFEGNGSFADYEDWSLIRVCHNWSPHVKNALFLPVAEHSFAGQTLQKGDNTYGPPLELAETANCLPVRGIIPRSHLDEEDQVVLTRGCGSVELRVGLGLRVASRYWDPINFCWATLWPIINSEPSKAFSTSGDSGSLIVDRSGRAAGILIAGCAVICSAEVFGAKNPDITYASPIETILSRLRRFHELDLKLIT